MRADRSDLRNRMVRTQIEGRGVRDPRVLRAMRAVPRERFVAPQLREFAEQDSPLEIDEGQTISQPYIVALMTEALELSPSDRVLEIGTGSGYAAAILAEIAEEVDTVERHESLAASARRRLRELGYTNVRVHHGDGTRGLPHRAPFDAIVVTAGGPVVPESLKEQLAPGGRLVIPVGGRDQRLLRFRRVGPGEVEMDDLGAVRFVPLIGEEGWGGDDLGVPEYGDPSSARRT